MAGDVVRGIAGGLVVSALALGCRAGGAGEAELAQPRLRSGYASVNGLRMYYELHGAPHDGCPPLVLLHGGGSTIGTSFGAVLPALARTRQVIALEQQGNGHTADVAGRPFTFEQSADDTDALLEQLGVARADVFGYSNGGSTALQLAVRHPRRVRKLVIASAMFRRDGLEPELFRSLEHASPENMPADLREAYLAVAPHPEDLPTMVAKSAQRMLSFVDWPPEVLRAIDAPALVLVGDADIVRPEHALEMSRLLPRGELAVLPGTDHAALVKRGDLLLALILPFLDAPCPE